MGLQKCEARAVGPRKPCGGFIELGLTGLGLGWPAASRPGRHIASLKVAGRFAQTLIKKVPGCVSTNPVQMAFSIAKVIIEMKDVCCRLVSWALVDYYIRRLEATKASLYVSKKQQKDSWLWKG